MDIALYNWKELDKSAKARIMRRAEANIDAVIKAVQPIIADVRARGDAALIDCAAKFEKAKLSSIKVTDAEFDEAAKTLSPDVKAAIEKCAGNVHTFHEAQMKRVEKYWMEEIEPGVFAGEQVSAIESVGLYVPRGKGAFPSALYMLAIPAVIAGVENIAVVTPPRADGKVDDATLFTARLCGVKNVFKCGGAQGIAALAYGTQSVPKVRKVLGPGSPYVAAAKRILSDVLDPGMPAGPSESIVLADESADPHNTVLDVLNEAEHGEDSAALLVTHSKKLADYVRANMPAVIDSLPEPHRSICAHVMGPQGYGGIILTESLEDSIAFANDWAPEHLHLKLDEDNLRMIGIHPHPNPPPQGGGDYLEKTPSPPRGEGRGEGVCKIKHAGEILIGEYTPSSLGNYGIGVNHVLPTGGWAHSYSCTSVWDFLKRTSISRCDARGFNSLIGPVTTLTDYEGFPAHGAVLRDRNTK